MAILNISTGNIDLYTNRMYILYKWLIMCMKHIVYSDNIIWLYGKINIYSVTIMYVGNTL